MKLDQIAILFRVHQIKKAADFAGDDGESFYQRVYTDDRSLDEAMAIEDGDVVIVMGAGSIGAVPQQVVDRVKEGA